MKNINENGINTGLLILRIGLGMMFIFHGLPKIMEGPSEWQQLGLAMNTIGVNFYPAFWGFCAAFTELAGGFLLIIGLFFRPACLLLAFTMLIAALMHLKKGDGLLIASHAVEAGIVFISMLFMGPGKYALDNFFTWGKYLRNIPDNPKD